MEERKTNKHFLLGGTIIQPQGRHCHAFRVPFSLERMPKRSLEQKQLIFFLPKSSFSRNISCTWTKCSKALRLKPGEPSEGIPTSGAAVSSHLRRRQTFPLGSDHKQRLPPLGHFSFSFLGNTSRDPPTQLHLRKHKIHHLELVGQSWASLSVVP